MGNKREMSEVLLIDEQRMKPFFNVLKGNIVRSKTSVTAVFLGVYSENIIRDKDKGLADEEITSYLRAQIRQTDILIKLPEPFQWCITLWQSKEKEAKAFLNRLFEDVQKSEESLFHQYQLAFSASVIEIRTSGIQYEELMTRGREALERSIRKGDWEVELIRDYKEAGMEDIKVSIIEHDEVLSRILTMSLKNLSLDNIDLEIQTFQDGYEFIESDWSSSGHTHLVIMSDILPRKNGFEVLHMIQSLPNNKRFIIFMMTQKNTEEDMIFAFQNGVDGYLVKPFNIRLFEAQVKGTLERLWK
ncbi:MAG TPA: response regulator [Bacillus sp. (in: firmicutes)]|nr:response regulator [Bacillus sp. (in: firmicutes)]